MKHLSAWCVIGLSLVRLAGAADRLEPKPDFVAGQQIRTEVQTETDQTLTLGGMEIPTKSTSFQIIHEVVLPKNSQGEQRLKGEFEAFQTSISLPGFELTVDKANPKDPETIAPLKPIVQMLRALAEAKWTAGVDPQGKVVSLEYEGFPFADLPEELRGDVSSERRIQQANRFLARLPVGPVAVGETWKRTEPLELGQGQTLTFEKEFTYRGPVLRDGRDMQQIDIKYLSVTYQMDANPASPVQITGSELTVKSSSGELFFDPQQRRIVNNQEKVQITGDLDVTAAGMPLPGKLDLTISMQVSTTVTPPASEK